MEVSKKEKEVLKRVVHLTTNEGIDKGGTLDPPRRLIEKYLRQQARDHEQYYRNYSKLLLRLSIPFAHVQDIVADSSPRESDQELGDELNTALEKEKKLAHLYANPHRNRSNASRSQPPLLLADLGSYRNGR